jgi:outer membrane protein assembly factor BamA
MPLFSLRLRLFYTLVIFYLFMPNSGFSQNKTILFTPVQNEVLPKNIKSSLRVPGKTNIKPFLSEFRFDLVKKGYFLASIDSTKESHGNIQAFVFLGPKFQKIALMITEEDNLFLRRLGFYGLLKQANKSIALSPSQLSNTLRQVLACLTQNGYPFAEISLVNTEITSNLIEASLKIDRGRQLVWKSIQVKGDSTFSAASIQSITGIHIGDIFNEVQWRNLDQKLKQINHIQVVKPSELLFTNDGVELFLYLKSARISSFNGALGLQPNPVSQKIGLTGELQLKLVNTLRQAEQIDFNWRSIQPATQSLLVRVNYPYLFKTTFGLDGKFNLYKRDSTFLEMKGSLAVQYQFKNGNYLKGIYQYYSSDRLAGAGASSGFSQSVSCQTSAFGLAFLKKELDYIPNPSKGLVLNVELFVGSRGAKTDTVSNSKSTIFKGSISFEKYIRLAARHVLKGTIAYDFYYAPVIYQNERFRFGGLTSLRGFNEEELLGTSKGIISLEYRFLVDKNSAAFVFYDQAIYEDRSNLYSKDNPFGTGVGFAIGSKIGIFSISYAIGKQLNNPFDLKQGKVHFGYIAYF